MRARARGTHLGYIAKFQFFHIRKILEKRIGRKNWKNVYEKNLENAERRIRGLPELFSTPLYTSYIF